MKTRTSHRGWSRRPPPDSFITKPRATRGATPRATPHATPRAHPLRRALLALGLLLVPALAVAQKPEATPASTPTPTPEPWHGFYAGGGGTYSNLSVQRPGSYCDDCYYFDLPIYDEGDGDYGFVGHVGYRAGRYFAVELSYVDAGTIGWEKNFVWIPDLGGYYDNDVEFSATVPSLTAVGIWPFLERWEAYLRLGVGLWEADAVQTLRNVDTGATIVRERSDDGAGATAGLGLGCTFASAWHVRVEYQATFIDGDVLDVRTDTSLDTFSLELQYRFGAR